MRLAAFSFIFLFSFICSRAQNKSVSGKVDTLIVTSNTDPDIIFKKAREYAMAKDYEASRKMLNIGLDRKPSYFDLRTYMARTFMWEKKFEEARTELAKVLIEDPQNAEALGALIDLEYWSGNETLSGQYLQQALSIYPNNEEFLLKKSKTQLRNGEKENGAITLRKILDINPGNKEALLLLNSLKEVKLNNRLQVAYNVEYFSKIFSPQQYFSGELGKTFKFGSIIGRVTAANRFNDNGVQFEGDNYLKIVQGTYIYQNAGYSPSTPIFPKYRFGWEIYQKLFSGFELSAGFRYLYFSEPGTTVYTASLSNYYKNYYFSLRGYLSDKTVYRREEGDTIQTKKLTPILNIRRYFGDAENFIGIKAGVGGEEKSISILPVNSKSLYQFGLEYQKRISKNFVLKGETGYAKENNDNDKITIGIQLKISF